MADNAPGANLFTRDDRAAVARRWCLLRHRSKHGQSKRESLKDDEWGEFTRIIDTLRNKPVYMSESETWTTASLRSDLTRLKMQYQIKWFVVDYLYLMNDPVKVKLKRHRTSARAKAYL
jgi:replicative DNA helicase